MSKLKTKRLIAGGLFVAMLALVALAVLASLDTPFTVTETISATGDTTAFTIQPNETVDRTYTVTNSGTTDVTVSLGAELQGPPFFPVVEGMSLLTDHPDPFVVLAGSSTDVVLSVVAGNGVRVDPVTLHVVPFRPD